MAVSVRRPAVAGMFYPEDGEELNKVLKSLFLGVSAKPDCFGVISPHAGYVYSGKAAARAISSLRPAKKFIILGPNHHAEGPAFSINSTGCWETPLGECEIDEGIAEKLKATAVVEEDILAHQKEHSIEVQLPFLQHRFRKFSFVPISIASKGYGSVFLKQCEGLGKAISKVLADDVAIIASSDFSHYLPKEAAEEKDGHVLNAIMRMDPKGFFSTLQKVDASVCGFGPIAVLLSVAQGLGLKGRVIYNSSSGDASGDFSSVVTYWSIGFYL